MNNSETGPVHNLGKEIDAAQNLLQLLKREESLLVNVDVDGLSQLTEEKAKIAAQMSVLARSRHDMLKAAGFEPTESGMQAWLTSAAATADDHDAWNELLALAQSGKELNRVNGLLIAQQLASNQNALNVLQGNPQGSGVYGPNGQSTTKIGGRRLVVG
ncbi:MAG: flagella synthesis protein FlgN [Noviherbaspirillum sp.]